MRLEVLEADLVEGHVRVHVLEEGFEGALVASTVQGRKSPEARNSRIAAPRAVERFAGPCCSGMT
jgi:hypothetical protein